MVDNENRNTPIRPSDTTIPDNYVALKPGNYKVRQDLTPYKGVNFTDEEMQQHCPGRMTLGVADATSAVFIYRQKTIEVIGRVYHGRRLIKPGVYSQFEKLRYLNDEIVLPLNHGIQSHRTAYNKSVAIDNPFIKQVIHDNTEFIQYLYVDFNTQMLSTDGNKVYPVPILNGRLRLYPDGSFETEGVVVRNHDKASVDKIGYLGDHAHFANVITFFNEITLDDVNPENVWQKLAENEDGSITYGPIEQNTQLIRNDWIRLPKNIIPVNDGRVIISPNGWLSIEGLVLTENGHPIITPRLHYNDVYQLNEENENLSQYVNTTIKYNPKVNGVILNVVGNVGEVSRVKYEYHYHNESYSIYDDAHGPTAAFRAMPGWDNFTNEVATEGFVDYLLKFQEFDYNKTHDIDLENQTVYPFKYQYPVSLGCRLIYPRGYFSNDIQQSKTVVYYCLVDHYTLSKRYPHWTFQSAEYKPVENRLHPIVYSTLWDSQEKFRHPGKGVDESLPRYTFDDSQIVSRLIPYYAGWGNTLNDEVGGKVTFFTKENTVWVKIEGSVLWRRGNQYYTLQAGEVPYITDWPDIKVGYTGEVSLFSVNGYFTDEPIFINKHDEGYGGSAETIDGIQRKEPGLFSLIKRNVTTYLTDWNKTLIDNFHGHFVQYIPDNHTGKLTHQYQVALNVPLTFKDSNLRLRYHAFKWFDVLPGRFGNVNQFRIQGGMKLPLERNVNYNHQANKLYNYNPILLRLKSIDIDNAAMYPVVEVNRVPYINSFTISSTGIIEEEWSQLKDSHVFDNALDIPIFSPVEPITIKRTHLLSLNDLPEVVNGVGPKNTLLFYRHYNDNRLYSGYLHTGNDGSFSLPIPQILDTYGHTEVWVDEPFEDQVNLVKVVYHLGDIRPIQIANKDKIIGITTDISGTAEPLALVKIYTENGLFIGSKKVDRFGRWTYKHGKRFVPGNYYAEQESIWRNSQGERDTFTIGESSYSPNDIVGPLELYGLDEYLYLVDLGVHHGESTLHFPDSIFKTLRSNLLIDRVSRTYTVKGLFGKLNQVTLGNRQLQVFSYFPEGTYNFGTHPEFKHSVLLVNQFGVDYLRNHITTRLQPKTRTKSGPGYQLSDKIYSNGEPILTHTLSFSRDEVYPAKYDDVRMLLDESWLIPAAFIKELRSTIIDNEIGVNNEIKQGLVNHFLDYHHWVSGSIARHNNFLVFEAFPTWIIPTSQGLKTVSLQQFKSGKSTPFTEYNGIDFNKALLRDENKHLVAPWWFDRAQTFNEQGEVLMQPNIPFLVGGKYFAFRSNGAIKPFLFLNKDSLKYKPNIAEEIKYNVRFNKVYPELPEMVGPIHGVNWDKLVSDNEIIEKDHFYYHYEMPDTKINLDNRLPNTHLTIHPLIDPDWVYTPPAPPKVEDNTWDVRSPYSFFQLKKFAREQPGGGLYISVNKDLDPEDARNISVFVTVLYSEKEKAPIEEYKLLPEILNLEKEKIEHQGHTFFKYVENKYDPNWELINAYRPGSKQLSFDHRVFGDNPHLEFYLPSYTPNEIRWLYAVEGWSSANNGNMLTLYSDAQYPLPEGDPVFDFERRQNHTVFNPMYDYMMDVDGRYSKLGAKSVLFGLIVRYKTETEERFTPIRWLRNKVKSYYPTIDRVRFQDFDDGDFYFNLYIGHISEYARANLGSGLSLKIETSTGSTSIYTEDDLYLDRRYEIGSWGSKPLTYNTYFCQERYIIARKTNHPFKFTLPGNKKTTREISFLSRGGAQRLADDAQIPYNEYVVENKVNGLTNAFVSETHEVNMDVVWDKEVKPSKRFEWARITLISQQLTEKHPERRDEHDVIKATVAPYTHQWLMRFNAIEEPES